MKTKRSSDDCRVKSCRNKVSIKKHQLCRTHYYQLLDDGAVKTTPLRKYVKRDEIKFI